jgi:iron complex transport system permease protein
VKHLGAARFTLILASLFVLLLVSLAIGLALGPSGVGMSELVRVLIGADDGGVQADIIWRIRLPRIALAALVGASLATSGAVFQALLRNPLADPFILGVSGGAALAAVAVLSLGSLVGLSSAAVPPAAFAGSVATTFLLYIVAGARGRVSATSLLLTGVVFNAFASAAIVFLASLSGMADGSRVFLWLIGNLALGRIELAGGVAILLALGLAAAMLLSKSLNLLSLGDEPAALLGVPAEAHKRILLVASSLMVGAAVSVSGLIGFVGLIVPHVLRLLVGPDHRVLVPASALAGAAFLVVCDTVARTLLGGRELPVGAITALLGGPLFLTLLRRQSARAFAL